MNRVKLTDEQKDCILTSRHGGHMAVGAVAGSGKTVTLTAIALSDPRPGIYLVYNRSIREEIQGRLPAHVKPMTGHSLAFRAVIANSSGYQAKFDAARSGRQISLSLIAQQFDCITLAPLTTKQASALVLETINQFQVSADASIDTRHVPILTLPAKIRVSMDAAGITYLQEVAADAARTIWAVMADEQSGFPILHDTYVKLFELRSPKINVGRFLCDEFQDANPVLTSIVRQQEGQKIFVGDQNQQIYSWRGAVNALGEFTHQDNVSTHNLTHSFRFGPEIAGLANRVLRGLGSSTQIRGVGSRIARPDSRKQVTVIARHNMTLLEHALAASERNQSFHLAGSSAELSRMIRSSYALYRGDMSNIKHPDLVGFESWKEFKATARLVNDPLLCQLASITDRYKARALDLADTITRQKSTPERDADIVLTTVHKAKGRQWSQVILAADLALDAKLIAKLQGREELSLEEREMVNVLYVALTRPQHSLSLPPSVQDTLKKLRDIPLPGTANTHLQTTHQTDPMREVMQDDPDSDSGHHRTSFQPA